MTGRSGPGDGERPGSDGPVERVGIAIVGGGPAGAVLAARLATAGRDVVVLERAPAWVWRAGGVFTSPAAVAALRRAGLDAATLAAVARPIPAMRVETPSGATFRLTYGAETGGEPAVGFDRSRLDPALLDLAIGAGADVRRGWHVTDADPRTGQLAVRGPEGRRARSAPRSWSGPTASTPSWPAAAGVARPARLDPRVGLTLPPPRPRPGRVPGRPDARPARRLHRHRAGRRRSGQHRDRARAARGGRRSAGRARAAVADAIVSAIPPTDDDPAAWRDGSPDRHPRRRLRRSVIG